MGPVLSSILYYGWPTVLHFLYIAARFAMLPGCCGSMFLDSLTATAVSATARNPSLGRRLFGYALAEAIALFGLMMAFLILFGFLIY